MNIIEKLKEVWNDFTDEEQKKIAEIMDKTEFNQNEKSKFNIGQLVHFTTEGINNGELMVATIPKKCFELDAVYIIKDISLYGDGWHILVHGSNQFVHEDYFLDLKDDEREKIADEIMKVIKPDTDKVKDIFNKMRSQQIDSLIKQLNALKDDSYMSTFRIDKDLYKQKIDDIFKSFDDYNVYISMKKFIDSN